MIPATDELPGSPSIGEVSKDDAADTLPADVPTLGAIAATIEKGLRINRLEAKVLWHKAPLHELGRLASLSRQRAVPGQIVTYLVDRNINYTNVCNTDCTFCGFYRPNSKHKDAYVLSRETIGKKIEELLALGGTRILLQGGHNDELPLSYYTELIEWIHTQYPSIEINSFSPSEIEQMSKVSGKSYLDILTELKRCGMRGLPGGGAEILDDEVRNRVSPKKIKADEWIKVMEVAHYLDLTTTVTMVIGFGETLEHRLNHFDRVRAAQDRSLGKGLRGFNSFISWPLQHNENTSMGRSRHAAGYGAGAIEYLRHTALARIYLDNIPHHQSSWPTLGPDVAEIGLHFGCDDIGSTMMEENVVSQAGAPSKERWAMSPEQLREFIREAGFVPAQRNTSFEILKTFGVVEAA
ncbi:MAG: CofH family radical SAM protein [Proteobacteria bacterium]|nr:CofH family radical SAM protein [Pseudomonadota bacterium]